jgi:hypothetical protein
MWRLLLSVSSPANFKRWNFLQYLNCQPVWCGWARTSILGKCPNGRYHFVISAARHFTGEKRTTQCDLIWKRARLSQTSAPYSSLQQWRREL